MSQSIGQRTGHHLTSAVAAPRIGPVMENLARHLEFQEKLEREGVMFAAGPHWTDDEQCWDGEGMVLPEIRRIAVSGRVYRRERRRPGVRLKKRQQKWKA